MNPASPIDVIPVAFGHMWGQLFRPVRAGQWLRLALVGLLTGELSGTSSSWQIPARGLSRGRLDSLSVTPGLLLLLIGLGLGVVLLALALLYLGSVLRFVLFEAVLTNECRLREAWRRYQSRGVSYFFWVLALWGTSIGALATLGLAALLVAWTGGVLQAPRRHLVVLILGGLVLVALLLLVVLGALVASVLAKDFVVPVMALEERGVVEGWRRVWALLGADKLGLAGYLLMKAVLAMGAALVYGFLTVGILLSLLLVAGLAGVLAHMRGWLHLSSWDASTLVLAGLGALLALLFLMALVALLAVPAVVFFQAYALHFLAARFQALKERLALHPHVARPPDLPDARPAG